MIDLEAKKRAVAEIVEGRVLESTMAVLVKGSVLGFPATLQAMSPGWPFGVTYIVETEVIEDPTAASTDKDMLELTVYPRMGRGIWKFFSHILLFEARGMPVRDKSLEEKFVFSHNGAQLAERFVKYPGISDHLLGLEQHARFSELIVRTGAGLVLSQPQSFQALNLDVCRATFRLLGEIGQVIFEAF